MIRQGSVRTPAGPLWPVVHGDEEADHAGGVVNGLAVHRLLFFRDALAPCIIVQVSKAFHLAGRDLQNGGLLGVEQGGLAHLAGTRTDVLFHRELGRHYLPATVTRVCFLSRYRMFSLIIT